jgi:hypothetical protein
LYTASKDDIVKIIITLVDCMCIINNDDKNYYYLFVVVVTFLKQGWGHSEKVQVTLKKYRSGGTGSI